MFSCFHICSMMLFARKTNFLFIFSTLKTHSAFVFTEEAAVVEEEDGELFKKGISFTGMAGKLSASGQRWEYSCMWYFWSVL